MRDTLRQKGVRPLDFDQDSRARVDAIQYIESLPDEVDDYRSDRRQAKFADFSLRGPSVRGLIDFVIQNFQYRYVSVHDYLRDYNRPGTRVVDLMLPALSTDFRRESLNRSAALGLDAAGRLSLLDQETYLVSILHRQDRIFVSAQLGK